MTSGITPSGLFVMPFSVVNVVTNSHWPFSMTLCRAWISIDVICSTASIVTLCVISIDRFVGVTRPLQYASLVTRRRIGIAVAGRKTCHCFIITHTPHVRPWRCPENWCTERVYSDVLENYRYLPFSGVWCFSMITLLGTFHWQFDMSYVNGSNTISRYSSVDHIHVYRPQPTECFVGDHLRVGVWAVCITHHSSSLCSPPPSVHFSSRH
jgi:hypothetical protein